MRLLITGGSGFIGSTAVKRYIQNDDVDLVVNIDSMTYAGNKENLLGIEANEKYRFFKLQIGDERVKEIIDEYDIDSVINFAAETHVDNSINAIDPFIDTNIVQTEKLFRRIMSSKRGDEVATIHISTDEVYGHLSLNDPPFNENDNLKPRNPYSATKAASELILSSYVNTYGMFGCITRCSNNYGPGQHTEKLIPKFTKLAAQGRALPIYGSGEQIRDWIHVRDHVDGIFKVLLEMKKGRVRAGEIYNFGGSNEQTNLDIAGKILSIVGNDSSHVKKIDDRPGHDFRYAIDYSKAKRDLEWGPTVEWEEGIKETVHHYLKG